MYTNERHSSTGLYQTERKGIEKNWKLDNRHRTTRAKERHDDMVMSYHKKKITEQCGKELL